MFPNKLGRCAMPMAIGFGGVQEWKARYSNGPVAHQIRELAPQLLKKLLGRMVDDDMDVMMARMAENGAGERGAIMINYGRWRGRHRKRLKVDDHSHMRFSPDLRSFSICRLKAAASRRLW